MSQFCFLLKLLLKLIGAVFLVISTKKRLMCSEIGTPKSSIINMELAELRWGVGRSEVSEEKDGKKLCQ